MALPSAASVPASSNRADPALAALEGWFASRGWSPAPFQRALWEAWRAGRSGLLHAPTGSGKTLAVWGGALLNALAAGDRSDGLRVLWITPLRALAADTLAQLRSPLAALGLPLEVERRTADSSPSERRRLRKRLPFALVSTPESLSLMLSYPDAAERFARLDAIVVDEWHELLGNRRGVQLELCLARLKQWRPALAPLLALQARLSGLPLADRLLAEWIHTRDGQHLVLHPFAGRTVHEGLAPLLATRLAARFGGT